MNFRQTLGSFVGLLEMYGFWYPVKHYQYQVSPDVRRGSRLHNNVRGYLILRIRGIRTIVNLCAENDKDQKWCDELGLRSLHIPVLDNTCPTLSQIETFLEACRTTKPLYVHCQAGCGRTGVFVACYRMTIQGWSLEQALEEAKKFGLCMPSQEGFLRQYSIFGR